MNHVNKQPVVAIIGMGHVGVTAAAALAARGIVVLGVESDPTRLELLETGRSPVSEPGVEAGLRSALRAGRFQVTHELAAAVRRADVVMIAVGTPPSPRGQADLTALDAVTDSLSRAISSDARPRVVMVRSTVPPGTTQQRVAPALWAASPTVAVCHHPEFLREGSALRDFDQPSMIVTGCDPADRAAVDDAVERLYGSIEAPRVRVGFVESELLKYAGNVFHAIKVDFANEIGSLAEAGADARAVMQAFVMDTRLNVGPAYLKPGLSFGGSCLPKDTRALASVAQARGLRLPLIESVIDSNQTHLSRLVERIAANGPRRTLLVGLSFKEGTDDLRGSPMVHLALRLLDRNLPLLIHDPDLAPGKITPGGTRTLREHFPRLHGMLCHDLSHALRWAEGVVLTKRNVEISDEQLSGKTVLDLTGRSGEIARPQATRVRLAA